jgi:hypothetical protein
MGKRPVLFGVRLHDERLTVCGLFGERASEKRHCIDARLDRR